MLGMIQIVSERKPHRETSQHTLRRQPVLDTTSSGSPTLPFNMFFLYRSLALTRPLMELTIIALFLEFKYRKTTKEYMISSNYYRVSYFFCSSPTIL